MTMCSYPFAECECLFCVQKQTQDAMPVTATDKPTCDCTVCTSGQAVNVQEWRKLDPRHEQVYQSMIAGLNNGSIQIQGALA